MHRCGCFETCAELWGGFKMASYYNTRHPVRFIGRVTPLQTSFLRKNVRSRNRMSATNPTTAFKITILGEDLRLTE